ncbi:hypothetical protein B8T70_17730 [Flavobacterium sp. AJR]|nr:hypothetical protein B8T70_17730 [Flavobacterium sp. AJR]
MSCEIKNNGKIIGKWNGTHEQKLYYTDKVYTRSCEIEFGNDGKGWSQLYNGEEDEKYPSKIFDYKIINDSIIFTSSKHPENLKIEYVSDTKLVLKKFSQMSGTITYDLNKVLN